ncbi:MAG TPA: hypothetical protein PKE62_18250 [Anaerolineales bacterium]|nr:hypothetical protein [Anaerolineales bacterium]
MKLHDELSNSEILTLTVYLLDGTISPVDLEDAAIEAFRLAPKKFSWIKYDDRIDLRIVEYALRGACRPSMQYLKGSNKHGYMLTQAGLEWAENYDEEKQISITSRKLSPSDLILKEQIRLRGTHAFSKFQNGEKEKITLMDFREFTRVNDYFPEHIRKQRYVKIDNAVKDDVDLKNVWGFIKTKFEEE